MGTQKRQSNAQKEKKETSMVYKYVSVSIGENQRFLIPLLVRTYLCKSCRPQRKAVVPVGKHLKCICGANGVRLKKKKNRRKTQSQAIQFESKPIRFRWPLETSLAKAYWIIFDLIFVTNAVWIPPCHTYSSPFDSWLNHLILLDFPLYDGLCANVGQNP